MFRTARVVSVALLTASAALAGDERKPLLVGDPAPALSVDWVKGDRIARFEPGTTYVVEFWATWCGPCRKAIPHLSELQAKYAHRVRFVGVSVWETDPVAVEPFVERMGSSMAYAVAKDRVPDDGSSKGEMAESWLAAAGQGGIPATFVVDGTGKIAWIGHPMTLDEPLAKIAAGEWDLKAATDAHRQKMAAQAVATKVRSEVTQAMGAGRWDDALAALDSAFASQPELERELGVKKVVCLLRSGKAEAGSAYGSRLVDGLYGKDPGLLNLLAWTLVDPEADFPQRDLALALRAAKRANDLSKGEDPSILDTYALSLFLSGDHAKAVEVQEKAVQLAAGSSLEDELKARLEEFRKKARTQG